MLFDCSAANTTANHQESTNTSGPAKAANVFSSPLTFVLLVWALMFIGLGFVLVYG